MNSRWLLVGALLVAGCDGSSPDPGCRCEGVVPGGTLNVVCGDTQCLGGNGYRCTGANTAIADPDACGVTLRDSGAGGCGPATCGGCCSGGVCQPGTTGAACGAGGLACGSCGGGTACVGGVCQATGCSVLRSGGDTCVGDDICICPAGSGAFCDETGTCSVAFGRRYVIFVGSVSLPDRGPDGLCWDAPGCGAPDPFVEVRVDGTLIGTSAAASNVYDATLDYRVEASIAAGSSISLSVRDEDFSAHDAAFSCAFGSVNASLLRSRNLSCSGALGSMLAVIVPL